MRGEGQGPFGTFPKIHLFWRRHPSLSHGWTVEMITYQVLLLYPPPPPSRRYRKLPKAQNSTIISGQTGSLNSFCKLFEHAKFNFTPMLIGGVAIKSTLVCIIYIVQLLPPCLPYLSISPNQNEKHKFVSELVIERTRLGRAIVSPTQLGLPETVIFFLFIFALDHQMTIRCQLTSSQSNFFWKLVCQISFQRILFLLIKSLLWIEWRRSMLRSLLSKIT